jgi:DNA-binding NtrC family response regulator
MIMGYPQVAAPARRVLVIDPDERFQKEMEGLLETRVSAIDTCSSFAEGLRRLSKFRYGCVIMEARLPEMMGYDAVPILRAIDPGTEIIVTTAENSKDLEKSIRDQNVFFFYIKSFERGELELAVSSVFEKRERSHARA